MKLRAPIAVIALLSFSTLLSGQEKLASEPSNDSKHRDSTKEKESNYLRVIRNKNNDPIAMQTSIVTFVHRDEDKADVTVDLIGAVHVADRIYFQKLNKLFTKYDALLYELVAPESNNIPEGGRSQHPVGQMQQGLKSMLDLSFQLEEVDYRKKNFVHADMSPEEFSRVMAQRDESFLKLMLEMMGAAMAMQNTKGRASDADILFALFAKDRPRRLKRVMSTQFSDLEGMMSVIEGDDGSTIIGQRNRKALEVLRREMSKGKKRIGIFYGAGHLPDMEQRLAEGFGMYPDLKTTKWLTAWDMK